MNLHGIVASQIAAVNPMITAAVRISTGQGATQANGTRPPLYAAPGALTGSIAGNVLTATAVALGTLQSGQTLTGATTALTPGTSITGQLSGTEGGIGTYSLSRSQTAASQALTTAFLVSAQVQPITWRDLQQIEGLNLNGTRVKIYLYGEADAIVRVSRKGGDLIDIPSGVWQGTYLTAQTLEQFPDWCSVACTLQNGS